MSRTNSKLEIGKSINDRFYIEYPIKLNKAIDVLFSHNELIHLWYQSVDYDNGYTHIWKGEAWALPKEYCNISIIKFFGVIPDKISEGDYINILVDAKDGIPINLPKNTPDRNNCSDNKNRKG